MDKLIQATDAQQYFELIDSKIYFEYLHMFK
jgi:hypothetical protein